MSGASNRTGHIYTGASVSGQGRAQYGDTHIHHQNIYGDGPTIRSPQDCLRSLKVTDPRIERRRIAENKDHLLKGSCAWVFEDAAFKDWWEKDDIRCLWIHGDPGKGKTMMAMAVIDEIASQVKQSSRDIPSDYISYFFCQGTIPGLSNAISVLQGLIYVLVGEHPQLVDPLQQALDREGSRLYEGKYGLHALWVVLQQILSDERIPRACLVIDALDECSGMQDSLLYLLADKVHDLPKKAKWIITSRNEPQIKRKLESNPSIYHTSLELNSDHVTLAVQEFIRVKVRDLNYDEPLRKKVETYLTANADGTFLWVALVFQELKDVEKRKVQSRLYRFPSGLEPLYGRMLEQIKNLPDSDDREYCMKVLRTTVLAYRPLHLTEFNFAADLPDKDFTDLDDIRQLINQCGSFLTIRCEMVYFVHQSAKDFLSDTRGCRIFSATKNDEHRLFAYRLCKLMSQKLKRNICDLDRPDAEDTKHAIISQYISGALQYSCRYWVDHLEDGEVSLDDDGPVHLFLREYCLYWLEVMSLVGEIPEAMAMLTDLESKIDETKAPGLQSLVRDTIRFMRTFSYILIKTPLQLYTAGLSFSPSRSVFRKLFSVHASKGIEVMTQIHDEWDACIQALEGHTGGISSVVFSPDGLRVASGSSDGTVRVWDVQTGQCEQALEGHTGGISSVVFSPDGSRVASGSNDRTVRVWDVQTGQCEQALKGHTGAISSVVFSPDGSRVASGSYDRTVRVWDVQTGQCEQALKGHTGAISSVVFSPDGSRVASGSYDRTVRVWDVQTGQCEQALKGHTGAISSVVFSPDGSRVASGSSDRTVRVWDVQTGQCEQALKGHTGGISSVVFSPDGSRVASGSYDRTVRVWDVQTGQCEQALKGHTGGISSVVFSPDGSRVASGSYDRTVRVWDVQTGQCEQALKGHTDWINSVVFSPDGSRVASGSSDRTVRVWDVQTGQCEQALKGHTGGISSVVFSPDGSRVASGSSDRTVRVWDVQTGQCEQALKGHTGGISSVVFSPDGSRVASGSSDHTVRVWDVQTGQCEQALKGHTGGISSVVFSPDGSRVASGSSDHTVRVWDVQTGQCEQALEGHTGAISSVVFSPDGLRVASGSNDHTVRVWDVQTGQCEQALKGHTDAISSVVFSPDGSRVASGSYDRTVRVWDVASTEELLCYDSGTSTPKIYFSDGNTKIVVNGASLSISFQKSFPGTKAGSLQSHSNISSSTLGFKDDWVTLSSARILWLPSEYRPGAQASYGDTIVVGSANGRVTFVRCTVLDSTSLW